MTVSVIPVICPQCGANLNIENGREYAFCSYCGAKILINNDNVHVYRTVDEASIMKAETDRIVRLRELELKEKDICISSVWCGVGINYFRGNHIDFR